MVSNGRARLPLVVVVNLVLARVQTISFSCTLWGYQLLRLELQIYIVILFDYNDITPTVTQEIDMLLSHGGLKISVLYLRA